MLFGVNCRQFLIGLEKHGKGDWRNISRDFVTTRTPTQVASHAQKYFIRQSTEGKDKRRSSIHDITIVNLLPDVKSSSADEKKSSPNHSISSLQSQPQPKIVGIRKGLADMKLQNEGEDGAGVFSQANGNLLMPPFCEISSYGQKLQEHNLLKETLPGYHFPPYNLISQQPMKRQ